MTNRVDARVPWLLVAALTATTATFLLFWVMPFFASGAYRLTEAEMYQTYPPLDRIVWPDDNSISGGIALAVTSPLLVVIPVVSVQVVLAGLLVLLTRPRLSLQQGAAMATAVAVSLAGLVSVVAAYQAGLGTWIAS